MGFKLLEDKLGAISHSSGVVSLGPSILSFGNQQYATSGLSRTIATDVTMTATTLYMVYAVMASGVLSLRVSANANSVGPAGFTSWKLVGAYYSNSTPAFGAVCNITGMPATDYISYSPTYNSLAMGGLFVPGNGTNFGLFSRQGQCLLYKNKFTFGSTTSYGGTTPIFVPIGTRNNLMAEEAYEWDGQLYDTSANTNWPMGGYDWSTNGLTMSWLQQNNVSFIGAATPFTWTTGDHWRFTCRIPTVGLSNTPLVDL